MGRALKKRNGMGRSSPLIDTKDTNNISRPQHPFKNWRNSILLVVLFGIISLLVLQFYSSQAEYSMNNGSKPFNAKANIRFHTYDIVSEFPHDPEAFTQGLLYGGNDTLYESTGLYGRSSVREVHLQTGKVQKLYKMKDADFGEGLTLLGERLFQVTWLTKLGFIYDRFNLSKVESFHHPMKDGWGLASDGTNLFGSDGSSTMYYLDPITLREKNNVIVNYEGYEVSYLNELEYVNGEVWANIWQSDCIARISPKDGTVIGWVLLHKLRNNLLSAGYKNLDVLNGIAWDEQNDRLFVTGKLWPKLYQIKLRPLTQHAINGLVNIGEFCHLMPRKHVFRA
eukprot:Gb_26058 [translate_table: standard]